MNKKNKMLLNDFANNFPLAQHIKVDITDNAHSYTPRKKNSPAYYDECIVLAEFVRGAEHFINYLERSGYDIKR